MLKKVEVGGFYRKNDGTVSYVNAIDYRTFIDDKFYGCMVVEWISYSAKGDRIKYEEYSSQADFELNHIERVVPRSWRTRKTS